VISRVPDLAVAVVVFTAVTATIMVTLDAAGREDGPMPPVAPAAATSQMLTAPSLESQAADPGSSSATFSGTRESQVAGGRS
jgi:hypothetical protein